MSDVEIIQNIIGFIENMPTVNMTEIQNYYFQCFGNNYGPESMKEFISGNCDETIKHNLALVYGIIFCVSEKRPQEIWQNELIDIDNVLDERVKETLQKKLRQYSTSLSVLMRGYFEIIETGMRGILTQKLMDVSKIKNGLLMELLTEVAIFKDGSSKAGWNKDKWMRFLKREKHNCEIRGQSLVRYQEVGNWELYAVTVQGSTHEKCDDNTLIRPIGKDAWFCCSADGVSSASNSHIGSKFAAEAFSCEIKIAYDKYMVKRKQVGKFMEYIRFSLAKDSARNWMRKIQRQSKTKEIRFEDYSTTFLFAFGCSKFIVCGMIGDGIYIVEKKKSI